MTSPTRRLCALSAWVDAPARGAGGPDGGRRRRSPSSTSPTRSPGCEAAGYRRYEVSNFALPGHECRHNLAYWRGEDYLGIGAAAVSTDRRGAPHQPADRRRLPGRAAAPDVEGLTPEIRLWEKAMLGLRTIEGVDEVEASPVLDPEGLRTAPGAGLPGETLW